MAEQQAAQLNIDTDGKRTSGYYGDDGDGTSRWFMWTRWAIGELLARTRNAAAGATDRGIQVLAVRRDIAISGVDTDGKYDPLTTDDRGQLRVATGELTPFSSYTPAVSHVVKASPASLYGLIVNVNSGETGYVQVHDAAAAPAGGSVPVVAYLVDASTANQVENIPLPGHALATGIVVTWSTTLGTYTAGSANLTVTAYHD